MLKTPKEWADEEGVRILDPDGWRNDNKSMDEPITYEEYERRRNLSTLYYTQSSPYVQRKGLSGRNPPVSDK